MGWRSWSGWKFYPQTQTICARKSIRAWAQHKKWGNEPLMKWLTQLKFDPTPTLLSSGNDAIVYFTKRDLLEQEVAPINHIWQLPDVQKTLRNQQADGSWKYTGKKSVSYPKYARAFTPSLRHIWWKLWKLNLLHRVEWTVESASLSLVIRWVGKKEKWSVLVVNQQEKVVHTSKNTARN